MSHKITTDWHGETVAVVSFQDPGRRNQLSWAAVDELGDTLRECREQGARVVILASGLDGHWLQHAWLQDLLDGLEGRQQTGTGIGWFNALQELAHEEVISIAAISGHSSGGGAELGWACDLRIAEEQACISQPEVDLGLTTGIGGCSRLARLAGPGLATQMVLTGEAVPVQRLHTLGAISQVVARGEALSSALALAADLVRKSPHALVGLKQVLRASENTSLEESLRREQAVFQSVLGTEEARESMQAAQESFTQNNV